MRYTLSMPQRINAEVDLPSSKSVSNRALIIHALSNGSTLPDNLSDCDDTTVIVRALSDNPFEIDIMAAGTAMRFMTAYLAVTEGEHVITGTERMQHRPIGILVQALRRLGADIEYMGEEGFPPLRIRGRRLLGGQLEIAGDVSSQFISALLMVGPVMERGLELRLTGHIISRPYIELTLCTMRDFGAKADWTSGDTITVSAQPYQPRPYYIESDWSAASYWYELAALSNNPDTEISLKGLMDGSTQGDSTVRHIFNFLGVKTVFENKEKGVPTTVHLKRYPTLLSRMDYDFSNVPDLAQTFVVTCCLRNIPFRFTGLQTLLIKETNRIEALKKELFKLGYVLHDTPDHALYWDGERCEPMSDPVISTYQDHRMAMSLAPAALFFNHLKMDDPLVVTKSYPLYWDDMRQAGLIIEES